jgi:hypothetical protein
LFGYVCDHALTLPNDGHLIALLLLLKNPNEVVYIVVISQFMDLCGTKVIEFRMIFSWEIDFKL